MSTPIFFFIPYFIKSDEISFEKIVKIIELMNEMKIA